MKITANKIDAFISTLQPGLLGALLYGPDVGLVSIRAETIGKKVVANLSDPFSVADIGADRVKEDPAVLADEFNAINFMGGRRLLRLKDADNNATTALKSLFGKDGNGLHGNAFLLVTAGELAANSSLRKFFEEHPRFAALPCYNDDERALESVVAVKLREKGISAERDAVLYIAANCQGDRLVVLQEIEKLDLYLGGRKQASFADVIASVGKTTETTLDDICHSVADGNQKQAEKHYRKAAEQGEEPIAILRSLERYFMRLRKVKGEVQGGKSAEQAIASLRPPLFFKHAPLFNRHVGIWAKQKGAKIDRALSVLYEAEMECKKTGSNPNLVGSRCVMRIASLAN